MSSSQALESRDVPALVLAAGRSTRIAEIAAGRPKPLLDVGGRSLLEWNLLWLASHDVSRVWINLHHEGDAIRSAIGSGGTVGLDVRYAPERSLLGTAGAWRRLRGEWRSTSLVVYGDNLMRFDIERLLRAHRETGARMTIALFDPARHANTAAAGGIARVEEGRVTAFREAVSSGLPAHPASGEASTGLVNAGVYALEPTVAELIGPGYQDFGHDVLPRLVEHGWVAGHVIEPTGFCLGLDTPERYERARAMVANGVVAL